MPIRVCSVKVFGGRDTVTGIQDIEGDGDHILVHGVRHLALIHHLELFESSVISEDRIFRLPAPIVSLTVERHGKSELLISFLLETGVIHYSLSTHAEQTTFECLQCFKCTRPIQSGLLWRDGGVLHVAYYDGFVRVGIIMEDYDDMLLVQRLTTSKNNLNALLNVIYTEIRRLTNYENTEHERRCNMLEIMKSLQEKIPTTAHAENGNKEDDELCAVYEKFSELKITFKNHSIRADRVSQRLIALKKLLALALKAFEANSTLEKTIAALELELEELSRFSKLYDECLESRSRNLIEKSRAIFEEKKYTVQELVRKSKATEISALIAEWDKKISSIIESLNGNTDPPKDMRLIISQHIYEHRAEKKDYFTHFLLDETQRDLTLYCMSGLTTVAVYPRKGKRVASITLDASYETSLTAVSLMKGVEGVYVADNKGVFPIYFSREKRYFDAGHQISIPSFDHITSILMENDGMILGSSTGGLLHLAFDYTRKYEHFIVASSMMSHPFSHGPINDLRILSTEDSYLALHCSSSEVVISERDQDRWHRVTYHRGGALCLSTTPFSLDHRGAFIVAGSKTYVRIKALQYTDDNLIGLHDLGESRVIDESSKEAEVLNVSLDPTMEFRPMPCKLRYAVGYSDKTVRTYVALLTGQHEFVVSEKFIAQIEPLYNVNKMICFHGRPMGCYVTCSKTLQVWNDLDRHQQKKMKSERMELHKMEVTITALDRAEGRSCYLLVGYKDNKVQIYEEKGRGTGKLESAWWIETCHGKSEERAVTVLRTRVESTSHTDRLFIHSLAGPEIFIHTVLMEAGKALEAFLVLSTNHALACALSFELLPSRPFEFVVYGNGIDVHKLRENERKQLEKYRDFEF